MIYFKKLRTLLFPAKPLPVIEKNYGPAETPNLVFANIPFLNARVCVRPAAAHSDVKDAFGYVDDRHSAIALVAQLISAASQNNFQVFIASNDNRLNFDASLLFDDGSVLRTEVVELSKYHGHRYIKETMIPQITISGRLTKGI